MSVFDKDDALHLIRMLDAPSGPKTDALMTLLMLRWPQSHLPEIYQIFGKDGLIKFLDLFAGMTVAVPSKKKLEAAARDLALYQDWLANGGSISVRQLASKHGVAERTAYWAVNRVHQEYTGVKNVTGVDPSDIIEEKDRFND